MLDTHNTGNKVIAAREGAISVVVSVINKHISSESVCDSACGALRNIAANAGVFEQSLFLTLTTTDNKVIAAREGAISVMLSVLNKHISSESVCDSACGALNNITLNSGAFYYDYAIFTLISDNKQSARQLGIEAVLNNVFKTHPVLSSRFTFHF